MYYKIKSTGSIVEPYYDELFHDCRRGAWTIRDVATKKQYYFNGFSVTLWSDKSREHLIDLINHGVANGGDYAIATDEEVQRYKLMRI